jgi:hypothetical protein
LSCDTPRRLRSETACHSYGLSVDLSGIIFVVLAVAWAVYLIPKALKHHDEVARTRSIDRFSTAMRVLARREPVSRRDARLVVTPPRAADNPRVLVAAVPAASVAQSAQSSAGRPSAVARPAARAAARAAARRRRRILSFLVLADIAVGVLAALVVVPAWAPAIPVALTLLYLVLCRTQVRQQSEADWDRELEIAVASQPMTEPVLAVRRNSQGFEEIDPNEDTITIPAVVDAVAVATLDGGSLWDPLPVTLPTYVSKPMAKRTVRTIDLNEPDAWSSGRSAEDSELVAASTAAEATADAAAGAAEDQRAVGS